MDTLIGAAASGKKSSSSSSPTSAVPFPYWKPPLTGNSKDAVVHGYSTNSENGTTEEVKKIVSTLNSGQVPSVDFVMIVVSPPYVFIPCVKSELKPQFQVAAQNCWVKKGGAFTGKLVCRRQSCVCAFTRFEVVAAQTKSIPGKISSWDNVVLAYEPVWAIVTGMVATPALAQEVHVELRKWLETNIKAASPMIIYGGFVNGSNYKELGGQQDVDVLVMTVFKSVVCFY
ncbi:hypothetical protein L1987_33144 [Smallanthus sonchifolius]|uniref:Uncharacterized protein n=1 Tax=Smallanthus sonchifolius TaxID=185202 RepID=A0ACB9HQ88_9ASTR|nr:hypothetical protein L1987_33144 [Smallanthus sonchifolius]